MNDTTNATVRYDSGVAHRPDNDRHSIQTYVSDMLALERHIREPLARQYDDKALSQFAGANDIVATMKSDDRCPHRFTRCATQDAGRA
jgi:hypothetical protein